MQLPQAGPCVKSTGIRAIYSAESVGHWILNLFPSSHSTGPIMNPITAPAPTRKSNNVEMNEWVRKWQKEWKKSKKEFQRKNWGCMFLFFQSTVDIKFWLWNCLLTMFISLCFSLFLVHLLGSYYFPSISPGNNLRYVCFICFFFYKTTCSHQQSWIPFIVTSQIVQ